MLSDEFEKEIRRWSSHKLEREFERIFTEELKQLPLQQKKDLVGKEILRRYKREDAIRNYQPAK